MIQERLLLLFDKYPLDFISAFGSSLPLIVGFKRYAYLSRSLRVLLLFFFMYLVGDLYTIWLGVVKQNNLFVLNIYPILGSLLLSFVYYETTKLILFRKVIASLGVFTSVICFFFFEWGIVSIVSSFLYRVYIIIITLYYFTDILSDLRVKKILLHSMFWVNSALLIYATGTLFVALFSETVFDQVVVSNNDFDFYWNIYNVLFIVTAILSSVGLWVSKYDRDNLI